jgi:hypothetical protein
MYDSSTIKSKICVWFRPELYCSWKSIFREQMISHLAGTFANFGVDNIANFALLRRL